MHLGNKIGAASAVVLARLGLIDEDRGKRIADLAWPRIVTGLARQSQRTADFIMVGIALGPAAIAGMGFSMAYWSIAEGIGFSLANGGMTFISQRFGADDMDGVDLAAKQTLWIELVLAALLMPVFILGAVPLVGLLGAAPLSLEYGSTYLQVVTLSLPFMVTNHVASRTLFSANDAWTPMAVRATGSVVNIALNAVFIFGLGLGVTGAALGTVIAEAVVAAVLVVGLARARLPLFGALPVKVGVGPPYFHRHLTGQILEVSTPLIGRRLISRLAQFFILAIVAQFGTLIVAAYVASREVRRLANTPGWGFGTSARSLVAQQLGADDEAEATAFGWDILRFAMAVYTPAALLIIVFAAQISVLFVDDPAAVGATATFVVVMAVSLLALGVDSATSGAISAAGDTRWPFYGRMLGLYGFMIPLAYLGTVTPLGIVAIFVAILAETAVPAAVSLYRFNSGKWIALSYRYREVPTD